MYHYSSPIFLYIAFSDKRVEQGRASPCLPPARQGGWLISCLAMLVKTVKVPQARPSASLTDSRYRLGH